MLRDLGETLQGVPGRAWTLRSSPTEVLKPQSTFVLPSDADFGRTRWWTVPLTPSALESFLDVHEVGGHRTDGWGGVGDGTGGLMPQGSFDWPAGPGLARAVLLVTIEDVPGGSAVRADTFVDPLHARTAATMVTGPVSSVDVVLRPAWGSTGVTRTFHVTDPGDIRRLTSAFDRLKGSLFANPDHSCPAGLTTPYEADLTFRTEQGTLTAHDTPASCIDGTVTVRRDGVLQHPTLDPGTAAGGDLTSRVERIVGWTPKQVAVP